MKRLTNLGKVLRLVRNVMPVVLGMVLCVGCIENIEPETVEGDVTVALRLDEAFQEMAYVRLTHDGDQGDLWYHMFTTELETDARLELETRISTLLESDGKIVGNSGVNRNITLEGLEANKVYRVIAAIVTPAGEIASNVAEMQFKTMRDPDVFEKHPDWNIQHVARVVAKDDPDNETELIRCTVVDTTETYVPCLLSADSFRNDYKSNYKACFEGYVKIMNDGHVKWPKVVRRGNYDHVEDRLTQGEYYLFMIGIDSTGTLTGQYAETLYKVSQETATEAYKKWLGDWTLSGRCGETSISYPVRIVPEENNLYYRMYGWESTTVADGLKNIPEELPILLYFEKSTGDMYVVSEELKDLDNVALADLYDFYLYGCIQLDYNGTMMDVPVDTPYLMIARFTMNSSNSATAKGLKISLEAYGIPGEVEFLYFNYSYSMVGIYNGLIPVTMDSVVPRINTMVLSK